MKSNYSRTSQIATPKGLASAVAISEVSQLQKFRFFFLLFLAYLLLSCYFLAYLAILRLETARLYTLKWASLQWNCSGRCFGLPYVTRLFRRGSYSYIRVLQRPSS